MRNLKRALSLALAAIMLLGMMVIGASAVDAYDDFTDKADIVNKDAVAMLTTLGIVNGKEDGSYFDPTGDVTRAEMAKMISVILNKGADINSQYAGMNSGLTDVSSNWAAGHINYCYTLDIIAGRGDGKFDPTAQVTAVEAAKMLLVAAGYDASIEGLTGASWSFNTSALASRLNIFDGYTKDLQAVLNRDDAALLIYNALDIELIQKYEDGYAIEFNDSRTVLSFYYGVYKLTGVVLSNQYAAVNRTGIDDTNVDGKTLLGNVREYASTTLNTTNGQGYIEHEGTINFNVETPVELIGKTIMMYVRKTTILANSQVLGVYLDESLNNIKETDARVSDMSDFLKGTGMAVDADTEYYVNYQFNGRGATGRTEAGKYMMLNDTNADNGLNAIKTSDDMLDNRNGVELTVIDNDDDGLAEYVLYIQEDLTEIATINEKDKTVRFLNDNNKWITRYNQGRAIDFDDVDLYDGAAEGDLVLVRTYGGHWYVTEPEVVSGEMESYSSNKTTEQWIKVNGETYKPSFIETTAGQSVDDVHTFDVARCAKTTTGSDKTNSYESVLWDLSYDFYLDSNGYVAAFKPTEKAKSNYALILNSGYNPGVYASDASGKVTALLADGTEGTYELNFSASAKNVGEQVVVAKNGTVSDDYEKDLGVQELKGFLGTDYTDNSSTRPWTSEIDSAHQLFANKDNNNSSGTVDARDYPAGMAKGYVVTYSLNDNGVMTIKSIVGSAQAATQAGWSIGDTDLTNPMNQIPQTYGAYNNGSARLKYDVNGADDGRLAIDEDTVAFYYTVVAGKTKYGVATGYSNMSNVDDNTNFIVKLVGNTDLVDMVLFDAEGVAVQKNYALILGRNTHSTSGKNIELDVVLHDGTVSTLTISRDNYEDMNLDDVDSDNNGRYFLVYAYTTNADGISTLSTVDPNIVIGNNTDHGYGMRLTNQTVAFADFLNDTTHGKFTKTNYKESYSIPTNTLVIDVTDTDNVSTNGTIPTNRPVHTILILDAKNTDKVITAFVWDLDADEEDTWRGATPTNPPVTQDGMKATLSGNTFTYSNVPASAGVNDYLAALRTMLGEGWTIKSAHQNNAGVVDSITAENADGISFTYTLASNSNPDPITIKKPNIGGEVEVKPVANNVPNSGNDLANGTMPGFSGMQGIDTSKLPVGTKLTAMTVELPLDNGKFYAVKEINSALATCHVGTANGTAGEDNGKYIKFATLTGSTTNTAKSFRLAVMVTDDKKPITLEVYSATTQIWDAMDQDGNKDKGNGWLNVYKSTTAGDTHDGLTLEYTITIDTTGITFDTP
jgi:hypothetical protein